MLFLVNPGGGRAARRRVVKAARKVAKKKKVGATGSRVSSGKRTARRLSGMKSKARRIGGVQMATKRKRVKRSASKATPTRRKRRKVATRRKTPVTRLARGRVFVTNGRRRRSTRRVRRNGIGGGILSTLQRAGKDALGIVAGVALTNLVARRIPYGDGNRGIEIAKKVAVAALLGVIVKRVAGNALAEKVVVGGMVAVANDLLSAVPVVGTALSGDADVYSLARHGLAAYSELPAGGMGSYSGAFVPDSAQMYRS